MNQTIEVSEWKPEPLKMPALQFRIQFILDKAIATGTQKSAIFWLGPKEFLALHLFPDGSLRLAGPSDLSPILRDEMAQRSPREWGIVE